MFALRKNERKLQYSSTNLLGFINTGYFTSDKYNEPDGIKYMFEFPKKAGYWLCLEMAKHKQKII
jgi:hypothetical protein